MVLGRNQSVGDDVIPFGKYRGKCLQECTTSYLTWLTEQDWFERDYAELFEAVECELSYRRTT